jgi:alpha-methylacyl-CoA racemase
MGPLQGVRVVEFAGIGPGPFCGMLLSDLGAEVLRVDRPGGASPLAALFPPERDVLNRGRRALALDLKHPQAVEAAMSLLERADVLIEGFRPGVMERLGLGPEPCLARNPRLVYGRMTGWGQSGPLAQAAGHDLQYIALSGALHCIGEAGGGPVPPLNLVGDFGGGGMLLAVGVLAALLEARASGRGQVVDAAMSDGAALLMASLYGLQASGGWSSERGTNLLDGGAPFYDTYQCADGRWLAVGPIEPRFYARLVEALGVSTSLLDEQLDQASWPRHRELLAGAFRTRGRDDWMERLGPVDACVAPVLDLDEAPRHPHHVARRTFLELQGVVQPAPAPRFSRSVAEAPGPPPAPGADSDSVLSDWGFSLDRIEALRGAGAIWSR